MNLVQLADKARTDLATVTHLKPCTVVGIEANPDDKSKGKFVAVIEMLEKVGIPDGMDLLGIYNVILTEQGEMVSFTRTGLRKRGDASWSGA